jgi:hypothetical protein
MPTYDIPSFQDFADGESSTVRSKLNANFDNAEAYLQGLEDRLEETESALHLDGVIWKRPGDVAHLIVSAGAGLSVNVSAGEALIGYCVNANAKTNEAGNGITDGATNYCFLMQDGSLYFNTTGTPPTSQRNILLATVTASGGAITTVNNYADGVVRGVGQPSLRAFICGAECAVRDAVSVSAANTVAQAQSDDGAPAKARVVGIILAKESATSCLVATDGAIVGGFTGLTIGSAYYLQTTAGALGTGKPTAPDPIVPVGIAVSTTALLVKVFIDEAQISGGGGGAHAASHEVGGSDPLTNNLDANARAGVRRNSSSETNKRRRLNFIEGTGIQIGLMDDPTEEEVEISIASTGTAAHESTHESGGSDELPLDTLAGSLTNDQHGTLTGGDHSGNLTGNARLGVRKNTGGTTYKRRRVNLIEGANIGITVADDSGDEEVDVTIAATGSLGPHAGTHEDGGSDPLNLQLIAGHLTNLQHGILTSTDADHLNDLSGNARVGVRKNSGGTTIVRRRLNLVPATGFDVSLAEDGMDEEVDITLTPSLPNVRQEIIVLVAGTLTASTTVPKPGFVIAPAALTIEAVEVHVETAPTGANLIVDIHKIAAASKGSDETGTTIYTTQGNRPTITAGGYYANATLPDITAIAAGDVLRVYVDQIGSTVAGSDLTVNIKCKQQAAWS